MKDGRAQAHLACKLGHEIQKQDGIWTTRNGNSYALTRQQDAPPPHFKCPSAIELRLMRHSRRIVASQAIEARALGSAVVQASGFLVSGLSAARPALCDEACGSIHNFGYFGIMWYDVIPINNEAS